jgi:ubiquilin
MLQQVLRNPEMRRMMFSPEMMRMQLQMQRDMGGAPGGSSFTAPGATDNTPQANAIATPNQPRANVTVRELAPTHSLACSLAARTHLLSEFSIECLQAVS